jgi:hypothetical protein
MNSARFGKEIRGLPGVKPVGGVGAVLLAISSTFYRIAMTFIIEISS